MVSAKDLKSDALNDLLIFMSIHPQDSERLIKKYPNRRLYDTETSAYITLADVKQLVMDSDKFKVIDAKTGDDLTRSILLQIILEEESGGVPMFSSVVLEQIIRFYGHTMQGMMGTYLEKNIDAFIEMQNKMAEQSKTFYAASGLNGDALTQFMTMQTPIMQNMMNNYLEQSKQVFTQMQEKMQHQAKSISMFNVFPTAFPANFNFVNPEKETGK
jgi:polyhydroxyalkanoate synthesis repressor PhaR